MKFLLTRVFVTMGILSFFGGVANHFKAHAKESSSASAGQASDTMGGRTGGCGKSN